MLLKGVDHIGLEAASKEAFDTIRQRLMVRGASDGFVTDFGVDLSIFFRDPDGLEGEFSTSHLVRGVIAASSASGVSLKPLSMLVSA